MSAPRCDKPGQAAIEISEATVEIEFTDTDGLLRFIEEMRKRGVEVEFDGVLYGLPWCG